MMVKDTGTSTNVRSTKIKFRIIINDGEFRARKRSAYASKS